MNPFEQARVQQRWREAKTNERAARREVASVEETETDGWSEERLVAHQAKIHLAKWALECAQTDEAVLRRAMFGDTSESEES